MTGDKAVSHGALALLEPWLARHGPVLEGQGISVTITWGPGDRNPASAWLDFETKERSARLILWTDGQAELTVGDFIRQEVLLDEHREISSDMGLDDAQATVVSWLA